MWQVYALLAAVFAALTAIFSKLGVRDVDSGLATAIRVGFILLLTWGMQRRLCFLAYHIKKGNYCT